MIFCFGSLVKWRLISGRHKFIKLMRFNKFMRVVFGGILVFFFLMGLVFAANDDWEGFNGGNSSEVRGNLSNISDSSDGNGTVENSKRVVDDVDEGNFEKKTETRYNSSFYQALGLILVGVLILVYLGYALLKKTKNRWKTK